MLIILSVAGHSLCLHLKSVRKNKIHIAEAQMGYCMACKRFRGSG